MGDSYYSTTISENGVTNRKQKTDTERNDDGLKKDEVVEDRYDDDIYLEEKIDVPEPDGSWFSWRKLWMFTGPGWLMSIAYLDPGNIESDMQSGAIAQYSLLWVLLWATVLGMVLQRLAARIGVVSGKHLAEICYDYYPKAPRIMLWLMVEVAIIGSDMQEVIGTAIALYLLSNKAIPLWAGTLITIADTFTFLFLDKFGVRKLEVFFAILIGMMSFSFGYQYFAHIPPQGPLFEGMAFPWTANFADSAVLLQTVAAIGAIIMPHNLYLHSALVKTRRIDRTNKEAVSEANRYFLIEGSIALLLSFVLNLFVVSVFGFTVYNVTYAQAHNSCLGTDYEDIFDVPKEHQNDIVEVDLYKGGVFLGCTFGMACTYIWAVGILASGQSSTMTGTYSGQFAMEGFLNLRWKRWQRVLLTRSIAMAPTFSLAYFSDINHLTGMNDILNAVMSIQLPFAVIPTLTFTSSRLVMGDFRNGRAMRIFTSIVAIGIIAINIYFVVVSVTENVNSWYAYLGIAVAAVIYFGFVMYLSVYLFICLGWESLTEFEWIQKFYNVDGFLAETKTTQNGTTQVGDGSMKS